MGSNAFSAKAPRLCSVWLRNSEGTNTLTLPPQQRGGAQRSELKRARAAAQSAASVWNELRWRACVACGSGIAKSGQLAGCTAHVRDGHTKQLGDMPGGSAVSIERKRPGYGRLADLCAARAGFPGIRLPSASVVKLACRVRGAPLACQVLTRGGLDVAGTHFCTAPVIAVGRCGVDLFCFWTADAFGFSGIAAG